MDRVAATLQLAALRKQAAPSTAKASSPQLAPRDLRRVVQVAVWVYRAIVLVSIVVTFLTMTNRQFVPRDLFQAEMKHLNDRLDRIEQKLP